MEKTTMLDFMGNVNKSETRGGLIPMEVSSGWPSIAIKNKEICITIPYFRGRRTQDGKTALYPISHVLTVKWSDMAVVDYSVLAFDKEYKQIDFSKPVGLFPHESVEGLSKEDYKAKRDELFSLYDELIECVAEKKPFNNEGKMRTLFNVLMEPSLYPMYKHISPKFYEKYCGL